MVSHALRPVLDSGRPTLDVAIKVWCVWLALTALEATVGSNVALAVIFSATIPMLVGYLIWGQRAILTQVPGRLLSVCLLGVVVFVSATAITLIGLVAATGLKSILV